MNQLCVPIPPASNTHQILDEVFSLCRIPWIYDFIFRADPAADVSMLLAPVQKRHALSARIFVNAVETSSRYAHSFDFNKELMFYSIPAFSVGPVTAGFCVEQSANAAPLSTSLANTTTRPAPRSSSSEATTPNTSTPTSPPPAPSSPSPPPPPPPHPPPRHRSSSHSQSNPNYQNDRSKAKTSSTPLIQCIRFVRDDTNGVFLHVSENHTTGVTEVDCLTHRSSTRRDRVRMKFDLHSLRSVLRTDAGILHPPDIAASLIYLNVSHERRSCPVCHGTIAAECECVLPLQRPTHPLDFRYEASNMRLYTGFYQGATVVRLCSAGHCVINATLQSGSVIQGELNSEIRARLHRLAVRDRLARVRQRPAGLVMPSEAGLVTESEPENDIITADNALSTVAAAEDPPEPGLVALSAGAHDAVVAMEREANRCDTGATGTVDGATNGVHNTASRVLLNSDTLEIANRTDSGQPGQACTTKPKAGLMAVQQRLGSRDLENQNGTNGSSTDDRTGNASESDHQAGTSQLEPPDCAVDLLDARGAEFADAVMRTGDPLGEDGVVGIVLDDMDEVTQTMEHSDVAGDVGRMGLDIEGESTGMRTSGECALGLSLSLPLLPPPPPPTEPGLEITVGTSSVCAAALAATRPVPKRRKRARSELEKGDTAEGEEVGGADEEGEGTAIAVGDGDGEGANGGDAGTTDVTETEKMEKRKQRNREAAARSNLKRKLRNEGVRRELASLTERAVRLRVRETVLRNENTRLRDAVRRQKAQLQQLRRVGGAVNAGGGGARWRVASE